MCMSARLGVVSMYNQDKRERDPKQTLDRRTTTSVSPTAGENQNPIFSVEGVYMNDAVAAGFNLCSFSRVDETEES